MVNSSFLPQVYGDLDATTIIFRVDHSIRICLPSSVSQCVPDSVHIFVCILGRIITNHREIKTHLDVNNERYHRMGIAGGEN